MITVELKNGDSLQFKRTSAANVGPTVRYEGGFAIVTDQHRSEHAYPAVDVKAVTQRRG